MKALLFAAIMACCYLAGRQDPAPGLLAAATARGYDAGREAVLADLPGPPSPAAVAQQCVAWWAQANIKEAKRRMCGK